MVAEDDVAGVFLLTAAAAVFGAGVGGAGAGVTGAGVTVGSAFDVGVLSGEGASDRAENSVGAVVDASLVGGSVSMTGCVVDSTGIVGTS